MLSNASVVSALCLPLITRLSYRSSFQLLCSRFSNHFPHPSNHFLNPSNHFPNLFTLNHALHKITKMQALSDHEGIRKVLEVLYLLVPLLALLFYVFAAATRVCTLRTIAVGIKYQRVSRRLILRLTNGVTFTYVSSVFHDCGLPCQYLLATYRITHANARKACRQRVQHNDIA